MADNTYISFKVSDRSYFAILKKEIHKLATDSGFGNTKIAEIDIIVAEMASNLIKHGGGGEILVRVITEDNQPVIELISVDSGPGMTEPQRMVEDGISTSNTLGHGLGSMKRLSDTFQIYSLKGWGTIVLARVHNDRTAQPRKRKHADIASLSVAKPGETVCGDASYFKDDKEKITVFLGDGLGHGPEARKAVVAAIEALERCSEQRAPDILRYMHKEVKKTRGLVGTIGIFDLKSRCWRICGIGNINTRSYGTTTKNHISYNGVIGMNIPATLNEQVLIQERKQYLIMCSDGVKSRWDLQRHPNIFKFDLSIVAAVIYKDFSRKTDDTSILIVKVNV